MSMFIFIEIFVEDTSSRAHLFLYAFAHWLAVDATRIPQVLEFTGVSCLSADLK